MRYSNFTRAGLVAGALAISGLAQAADEAPHSMTGCLRQGAAAGTYELTDLGLADGPKSVAIAASSVDLAGHVGHKVELTGTTVKGADAAGHTMSISAMKHLAATCP
jgi:hypothetical protein